jgi:hydroxyacylglutathione hydrolase
MMQEITTIRLPLPFRMGSVNCYLAATGTGYVLIDTGGSNERAYLESQLTDAGCQPDDLALIVLTHGDFDHTGNAAYLGQTFGAKIAMHAGDLGMVERGDMSWNRNKGGLLLKVAAPILFGFGRSKRFTPDFYVQEGADLSAYGFDARVLSIPGHSAGSIGIVTANGDLFCGDLLENVQEPTLGSIMDDPAAAKASLEKLQGLEIRTVYPGHGQPFLMEEL